MAFQGAIGLGIREVELDVRLSRDGQLVVFHDETLERTTEASGPVSARSLAELRSLDAAYRFASAGGAPLRGQAIGIPTLGEVFALDPELRATVEMKGSDPSIADALFAFIEARGLHDRVVAASAKDDFVARFRAQAGARVATSAGRRGIQRFWLVSRVRAEHRIRWPFEALQVPRVHRAFGVPLTIVDARFVEAAHALGIDVYVWTIDDPLEMRALAALGVDAIMSDRPEVLLHAIGQVGVSDSPSS